MDFNQTLQILQEKWSPPEGSLMAKIWNKFSDSYGLDHSGSNKLVFTGSEAEEFYLLIKDYLVNKLGLTAKKGNEYWSKGNEKFDLIKKGRRVELIFN